MENHNRPTPGALAGVRVIELGSLIAGPFAARVLADFGADVIKVENPRRPDPMRDWGRVRTNGRSLWWAVQSRGKRTIALDLKLNTDAAILAELLEEADVLVENFRPGTLEKMGFGPEALHRRNPKLIIARVSGYGQTGTNAPKPGYAAVAEAAGGLRHLNGYPGQAPPRSGISLGDSLASLYAVQGILTALYWRDVNDEPGQIVDVSLIESCFSLLEGATAEYAHSEVVGQPSGSRLSGIAPSNIYLSRDEKWVVIAANQDTIFTRLAIAMGRPELADDPRYATHVPRGEHQDELDDLVGRWAASHSALELRTVLDVHGVPNSRVNSIADIFEDPLFTEREMLLPITSHGETITQPGVVPKLSLTPGRIRWNGSAAVGEHQQQILTEIHRKGTSHDSDRDH